MTIRNTFERARNLGALGLILGFISTKSLAGEVRLAAAASLKETLDAIKVELEKDLPETRLTPTYAASGTIQQQIAQGAPIDIFLSAAKKPMDKLDEENLIANGTRRILWTNQLALIAPRTSTLSLKSLADLTHSQVIRIALGEPRSVPAGEYAMQSLQQAKLAPHLKSKIIFAKDVRQVLSYVARGEVEAGFVYATDMRLEKDRIKLIQLVDEATHEPIVYEVARITQKASAKHVAEIEKVLSFLNGSKAKKTASRFGFKEIGAKAAQQGKIRAPI